MVYGQVAYISTEYQNELQNGEERCFKSDLLMMIGSKFGIDDMQAWIHYTLYQWFRLVVVV